MVKHKAAGTVLVGQWRVDDLLNRRWSDLNEAEQRSRAVILANLGVLAVERNGKPVKNGHYTRTYLNGTEESWLIVVDGKAEPVVVPRRAKLVPVGRLKDDV